MRLSGLNSEHLLLLSSLIQPSWAVQVWAEARLILAELALECTLAQSVGNDWSRMAAFGMAHFHVVFTS